MTPYARSGALVDFAVRTSRSALVELVQADGSAVPVGAQARLASGGASFTVARRGEVYVTGLEQSNTVEVTWPGKRCDLIVELPTTGESRWEEPGRRGHDLQAINGRTESNQRPN